MAQLPVAKLVASTGASGAATFLTAATTHQTAITSLITTIVASTGATGIQIAPTQLVADATSGIFEFLTTVTYTVIS